MKVEKATFHGWDHHPVYRVRNYDDWCTLHTWMEQNECAGDLISSGGRGYIFQVKQNHDWFVLRWA